MFIDPYIEKVEAEPEDVFSQYDSKTNLEYFFFITDEGNMAFYTNRWGRSTKITDFPEFLENYKFVLVEDGEIKNKVITIHVRLENPDQVTYSIWKSHNLSEWVQLTNEEVKAFYKRQGD